MRKIRTGIFETNSSSVHCICIANDGDNIFVTPKVLSCITKEFGWDHETYFDTEDKADYLLTMIYTSEHLSEYLEKFRSILHKHGIELGERKTDWYYIDHNSEWDNTLDELLNNEELLMNFLFNPDSYVETANDNDNCIYELYRDIGEAERYGYTVYVKGI